MKISVFAKKTSKLFNDGITEARWGVKGWDIAHFKAHFQGFKSTPFHFPSIPHQF